MAMSTEEQLALAEPDPELTEVLQNGSPFSAEDFSDPNTLIKGIRAMMSSAPQKADPTVAEKNVFCHARDGFKLRLRVFKPAASPASTTNGAGKRPLIVLYHGGGFTIGTPELNTVLCQNIVKQFDAVCISPQYRLGPEDPFPAAVNDAWDALKWIAAHASSDEIGADPQTGFVVGGISAGGNLTAVLSHLARDEKLEPPLTGLYLGAPSLLLASVVPEKYKSRYLSRTQEECLNAAVLDKHMSKLFTDAYNAPEESPLRSPFVWPSGHAGLPKTYLQVCGMDINRDEALLYEEMLREDFGVQTKLDVYKGLPHTFWAFMPQLKSSEKWRQDTLQGMAWLLGG